jgi:hypothetical protein
VVTDHVDLGDLVAGTGTDDHVDITRSPTTGKGTNVSYVNLDGDALRNSFGDGSYLGDGAGVAAADIYNRYLIDIYDATSIDWQNRYLYGSDGIGYAADWGTRLLYASIGEKTLDWENSTTYDANTATKSIDWASRYLYTTSEVATVDWEYGCLYDASGSVILVDWQDQILTDGSDYKALDWASRVLYDSDGSTQALTWSDATTVSLPAYTTAGVLTNNSSGNIVSVAPVADGTYTVGIGTTTNGTITITNGIITAIQEAS